MSLFSAFSPYFAIRRAPLQQQDPQSKSQNYGNGSPESKILDARIAVCLELHPGSATLVLSLSPNFAFRRAPRQKLDPKSKSQNQR